MNRTPESEGPEERRALLLAAAAITLWSTVAVAFKKALVYLSPTDLVILASFVSWAGLGMTLLIKWVRNRQAAVSSHRLSGEGVPETSSALETGSRSRSPHLGAGGKTAVISAFLGLLNPILYYLILFGAYDRLPAQAAQPLNYTWPLFLSLLAAPISRRFPSPREILALVVSFVGVILISWRPVSGTDSLDGIGVVLALGSGIIWALYWLLGNRLKIDGGLRLFWGFSMASVILAVLWRQRGFPLPSGPEGYAAVIWIGLFEMGITFLLWDGALANTARPARIGNLVYLGPFVSLLWIRLFLGERIRPATVAGLAVIVLGILVGRGIIARRHRG